MPKDELTYSDLLQIVDLIKSATQFSEFRLKVGDIEVHLKRKSERVHALTPAAKPPGEARQGSEANELPATTVDASTAAGAKWPEGAIVVRSPMVGTYYRAPEPAAKPFVEVGDEVEADTTVCIIEVMKLMNSIPAGVRGVVRQVLVADAQAVEYGQPLMVLEPR